MTEQAAARVALVGLAIFFGLAFGLRSWVHYRRTGSSGFVGLSGRPGSAEWLGGVLFGVALVGAGLAPFLQLRGSLTPYAIVSIHVLPILGIGLFLIGMAGTLWAQFAMGESWRIGVDAAARTALVATGPFRWVRNPIYTFMLAAMFGVVCLVPNTVALAAIVALVVGLEIQVRLVEEPYLSQTHGRPYAKYAAAVGRFLPGVGYRKES